MGYVPRINLEHGIYLGDTIVENVSGKAYLNVISTLDEEVEVRVPALSLQPLNEFLEEKKINDGQIQSETENNFCSEIQNGNEYEDEKSNNNYEIENEKINKENNEENYYKNEKGNNQTPIENHYNQKILTRENCQISRTSEGSFQTSLESPSSVDCRERSNQTSCKSANPKKKNFLSSSNCIKKYLSNQGNKNKPSSSISEFLSTQSQKIIEESTRNRELQYTNNNKFKIIGNKNENKMNNKEINENKKLNKKKNEFIKYSHKNQNNSKSKNNKNKPSSEISEFLLNRSREIINKSTTKDKTKNTNNSENLKSRNCLIISKEIKENRLAQIIELLRLEHLNEQEKENVIKLIKNSQDQFHVPGEKLTATPVLQHRIITTDDQPINTRQYRFPQLHKEEINKQVEELLENGIVKHSQSPYNTPVWIVPKKEDSKGNKRWRMVLDFRALNNKTIGDAYPLPNIVDILDQLGGAQYFSVIDLASGFHQIKMHPEDSHKTAFTTPFGHYEFDRMPFGLKNAPATFQRLMDLVLTGLQGEELFVYMDDIVIYAKSLEEHERKYNALIQRLQKANLKLQPDKCEFLKSEVTYLGHVISRDGVKPDPKKLEAVENFPHPKTPKNIKQFLGLAGYYRRFIPNFSNLAKPLTNLLKNDTKFKWTSAQEDSFQTLKQKLCEEPVLQYPDFSKPFILTTDASGIAIGGILSQGEINKDRPVAYASRTLTDADKKRLKYDTYEKEALAIIYCVKHFRPYLYGRKFTLVTDHKPLTWFQNAQDANMRILRWRLKLAEYNYDVVYKAGKTNVNADALSRNPVNLHEIQCKIIKQRRILNPNNPEDAEEISKILEESDNEEEQEVEDDDLYLHYSDSEEIEDPISEQDLLIDNIDTQVTEKSSDSPGEQVIEKALIHDPPTRDRMRTRSQTTKLKENTEKIQQKNELPNEEDSIQEYPEEKENVERKDKEIEKEEEELDEINKNIASKKKKPVIIENKIIKSNIIDSRDLLFLRKDHVAYFVDIHGNPLDAGSQKLFERNELPNLESLTLGKAKAIKHKKYYHVALPICEESREGPTLTLNNIINTLKDLRHVTEKLKLETISIAKTELINNVPWNNIKSQLQIIFIDAPTKLIICNEQIKYPPKDLRSVIISEMHSLPTGGHRGVTKTYSRIKHNYYWENLKSDVQKFIQQCLQCQLKKLVRVKTKQPMVITDTPGSSFDKVAMDIVGPLPKTENGNEYILTLQDQLTKFSMGIPLPNQTSETIAEAFVDRFICTFGAPKAILTDQGRNFISDLMKKIAKLFKIRKFRTTAFHPQSNGSLERSHHALGEYLKQYANERKQWDRWIGLAMFNYNTNIHEATKHTPYELIFGKIARIPSNEILAPDDKLATYDEYLINLVTQLHSIQKNARETVVEAKIK